MVRFEIETEIMASRDRCFDWSRDLDLHLRSMARSGERAVAGRTSGLIGLGEEVTWRARHFGLTVEHCSRVSAYDRPRYFQDVMVRGRFRRFVHDHYFEENRGATRMRDVVEFASPFGVVGRLIDALVLRPYLRRLITARNGLIRREAERAAMQVEVKAVRK